MFSVLRFLIFAFLISVAWLDGVTSSRAAESVPDGSQPAEPSAGERMFVLRVAPLFASKCAGCHADDPEAIEGGFDLRSRATALAGGDSFGDQSIVAGDSNASEILSLVRREVGGMEMPPKESESLTEEEVWAVRDWIDAGAPWPDKARSEMIYREFAEGVTVATSGGLSPAWTNRKYKLSDLWAFQPIRRSFEKFSLDEDRENPVDTFIDTEMSQLGIEPAGPAERRELIRRATFDLLGLPPRPTDVEAFVKDPRSDNDAFAALVDRLLDSPQYGEQWGRHWLDVVRYSDSSGFANDWQRPNAWRYRDYVVRAFNDDKPFDEFIREQIAGDEQVVAAELAGEPLEDAERAAKLIAAGFLRMGAWEHTGMSVAKVTRQLFLDDITDTVGQVFLGQALQCCRCHDHKFDPIPTRDFYSIQAVFATTQFAEVDADWLPDENLVGMEDDGRYHELSRQESKRMLAEVDARRAELEAAWFQEHGLPYRSRFEAKKAGASEDELPPPTILSPADFGLERIGRKWTQRFDWERDRYRPIAYTVYDGKTRSPKSNASRLIRPEDPFGPFNSNDKGQLEQSTILTGGDPFAPGQPVTPGVLTAVPGALDVSLPTKPTGRRLALADWIADPDNSLTSRVIANRVWAGHFSRGVAGNPNNFGTTGKKPTHPELLDWLAGRLVQEAWSIKQLHRVIMNSDAYRRSSRHPNRASLSRIDPNGESYAVFLPRRLEAEEIRDASLLVSGELNLSVGGIPIRPDMNLEAALQPRLIMGTFAPAWVPNPKPEQRNRRSIYIQKLRGHRLPFMETFNQPGSETSCELRDASNITPQVFALMNGQESNDRALALAVRVIDETSSDASAIERVYRLAFGRDTKPDELELAIEHWRRMISVHEAATIRSPDYPTEVSREAVDENTGEPFKFTEKLFAYQDYVPDIQPNDVDVKTRALSDVCLAILNANEFLYVY